MQQGKIIIFSAPSGSGKTSIVKQLLAMPELKLEFSISATSREKRPGEEDGKDYYFFSPNAFRQLISDDKLLEWQEVYPGQFYGTLKSEVDRIWQKGNHILFDIDVVGGLNVKKMYPQRSLAVFVKAPSIEALEERLKTRGTENKASLKKRINKAEKEMEYASEFDYILVNDVLDKAVAEARELVNRFLK
ncbi:MAG: guanylate kinase [Bacteroidota bacterium]